MHSDSNLDAPLLIYTPATLRRLPSLRSQVSRALYSSATGASSTSCAVSVPCTSTCKCSPRLRMSRELGTSTCRHHLPDSLADLAQYVGDEVKVAQLPSTALSF
jgi:hypothetical protein